VNTHLVIVAPAGSAPEVISCGPGSVRSTLAEARRRHGKDVEYLVIGPDGPGVRNCSEARARELAEVARFSRLTLPEWGREAGRVMASLRQRPTGRPGIVEAAAVAALREAGR
jgi:hypothetical protein